MSGIKFAAIRRRVQRDTAFRARLRAAFDRTLAEEGLLDALTRDQVDDLHLAVLLHDALRMPDPRRARRAPPPVNLAAVRIARGEPPQAGGAPAGGPLPAGHTSHPGRSAGQAGSVPARAPRRPVDFDHWRTGRAGG